jgi:DNA-binding IclR family transcriptional regulator
MLEQTSQASSPGAVRIDDHADERVGVTALERGLNILDTLGLAEEALTLKELAARTGLSKPTVLRLSVSLERYGYIARERDGGFRLGATLWRLGMAFRRHLDLGPTVRPALQALVALTQESASFWVPRGHERICLFRVNSPRSARSHVEEGETSPVGKGAGGHVVAQFTGRGSPYALQLETEGVVATIGERDPDVASVAAPVFGPDREFIGAVVLAGILGRFEPRIPDFKPIVKQAAATISQQLSGLPAPVPAASGFSYRDAS